MTPKPDFNLESAHHFFAADCFNRTWELIERPNRSPQEDEQMLLLSLASLWHWTQRGDVTPKNLSVGHWQVARVYALLGQAENAHRYAQRSLELAQGEAPFQRGYAYEALARAEAVGGDAEKARGYLEEATKLAALVDDEEDRNYLVEDLKNIGEILAGGSHGL